MVGGIALGTGLLRFGGVVWVWWRVLDGLVFVCLEFTLLRYKLLSCVGALSSGRLVGRYLLGVIVCGLVGMVFEFLFFCFFALWDGWGDRPGDRAPTVRGSGLGLVARFGRIVFCFCLP